jgi:hypothetical protein
VIRKGVAGKSEVRQARDRQATRNIQETRDRQNEARYTRGEERDTSRERAESEQRASRERAESEQRAGRERAEIEQRASRPLPVACLSLPCIAYRLPVSPASCRSACLLSPVSCPLSRVTRGDGRRAGWRQARDATGDRREEAVKRPARQATRGKRIRERRQAKRQEIGTGGKTVERGDRRERRSKRQARGGWGEETRKREAGQARTQLRDQRDM